MNLDLLKRLEEKYQLAKAKRERMAERLALHELKMRKMRERIMNLKYKCGIDQ